VGAAAAAVARGIGARTNRKPDNTRDNEGARQRRQSQTTPAPSLRNTRSSPVNR